jgi:hypothetical protein
MKYTLDLLPVRAFQGRGTPVGGRSLRLYGGGIDGGYSSWEIDQGLYGQPAPAPAADINSLYQDLLGRAPDPTGIAANAGASITEANSLLKLKPSV